jgi:hypothetical protein
MYSEKLLEKTNWFVRPLAKLFYSDDIEGLRSSLDYNEAIRQEYKPDAVKSNLVKDSKRRNNRSRLLQILGFYTQEEIANKSAGQLWEAIHEQVQRFRIETYDKLGVNGSSWVHSDFFVWTLHLWAIYRRLRFEGSDGEVIARLLCDRFWLFAERQLMRMGVSAVTLSKNTRQMQEIHYGLCVCFDEILVLGVDSDALIAEIMWRNIYAMGAPDVTGKQTIIRARHVEFWVNYLNYLISWQDHIDSVLVTRGLLHFQDPNSSFVCRNVPI